MGNNIKNKVKSFSSKSPILSKGYRILVKLKSNMLTMLSDEQFAKIKHYDYTGRMLNLNIPQGFNEKLWWLKINNRDPLLTRCTDKVEVRNYVAEKGYKNILVNTYGVYDDPSEIDFDTLPEKAFIKTNHGSGTNILWDRHKPFDKKQFINNFKVSLNKNYYMNLREWNYKDIKPQIIIEEVLVDLDNVSLIDYRFFCFDGKCKLVFVDTETVSADGTHSPHAKRNIYDTDFNLLNVKATREHFDDHLVKKPNNFEEMIKIAEDLAKPFVFSRIDLYNIRGKIYFGEITFYPGSGNQILEPEEWEQKLGSWIDLDSDKIITE